MSAAIVHVTGAVARVSPCYTDEQLQMIRDTFANGATEAEFHWLMQVANARGLNPLLKQIHFVKRYDGQKRREVWSTQASIDGLRAIAERSGLYDGQDEPEYVEKDGRLEHCKVRVYRKDWTRPVVGVAYWSEYVQLTKEGAPTSFWKRMPHVMLAKCAEALAIRKAFPEGTSGLYTPEEMGQAKRVVEDEEPELDVEDVSLEKQLAASIDWPRFVAEHTKKMQDAPTKGAFLEVLVDVKDEMQRLSPPKVYADALYAARDEIKAAWGQS